MAAQSQPIKTEDDLNILKYQLYHACEETFAKDYDRPLNQDDLFSTGVVPDKEIKKLLTIVSLLTKERLFVPVNLHSGLAWRLRPEAEAKKYKLLNTQEQVLVYEIIDAAGAEGSWQQDIKRRLNIQDNALRKALKELEVRRLVTQFTSVDNITKKMWIKSNIQPSARTTGGPFYTDSVLDEDFIGELMDVVVGLAKDRGAYRSTRERRTSAGGSSPIMPKKGIIRSSAAEVAASKGKKRTADAMTQDDSAPSQQQPVPKSRSRAGHHGPTRLLPLVAGYKGYVTTPEIREAMEMGNVAKGQALKDEHIQELINVLIWEGRIEEVKVGGRVGYRLTRVTNHHPSSQIKVDAEDFWIPRSNGLTSAPCGRCPVFDLCEEGGPVWAGGCEYFDQWLG